jgi:hypothetical protein
MGSELQSIFFVNGSTFLSSASPCIVRMNNEFSPIVLWLELSQCCLDIITIVLDVKVRPLGSATIKGNPNGNHDFPILDRMPRSFRQCFSKSKPDLLMVPR